MAARWLGTAVVAGLLWYLLVAAASLFTTYAGRVPTDMPPALPLIPVRLLGLGMNALVAAAVVALVLRRPWPVVSGVVLAAAVSGALTVAALRAGADAYFYADRRVLAAGIAVLVVAVALGLAIGLPSARRPGRVGVGLAVAGLSMGGWVAALALAVHGGPSTEVTWLSSLSDLVTVLTCGAAAFLLARHGRIAAVVLFTIYVVVVPVASTAAFYFLSPFAPGSAPDDVRDQLEASAQVARQVALSEFAYLLVPPVLVGAVLGHVARRSAAGARPGRPTDDGATLG